MSLAKKLKMIVKGERKPTFGTDPNEPWSVRAGITESESDMLHAYLKSRGINPEFVSKDTKISHSKSNEFQKWKRDHMFDDPADTVSSVVRDKMKAQREQVELDEFKTLTLTPVEKRQKALNRAKRLTSVLKPNGLHQESVDKEDTITFDIPLLIRMFEYAREDAKTDMDLHKVTEKLISIRDKGTLTMADYDFIVKLKESVDIMEKNDPCWTGYTQVGMKNKGGREVPNCVPSKGVPKAKGYKQVKEWKTNEGSALDRFRAAAAEREKKHNAIEKARQEKLHQDPSKVNVPKAKATDGMSAAIDRLEKHLNKEEFEQIDELKQSTLSSYKDKSTASLKNAQANRDAAEAGKNMSKGFADLHAKSDAIAKKRVKGLKGYLQRKVGMKPTSEDVYQDSQAATQTAFDMGTQPDNCSCDKKREMSKSARMIKALYKKHKMVKEDLYDHEKEDKSVATYGKKPKVQKIEGYSDDEQASMVLKGGTTLTGQTRDTLEIDPVMRKSNKNNDNKSNK